MYQLNFQMPKIQGTQFQKERHLIINNVNHLIQQERL